MAIINSLASYWPPENIAEALGVPIDETHDDYNYYSLELWTCSSGPLHLAPVWATPVNFFTKNSDFGSTNE